MFFICPYSPIILIAEYKPFSPTVAGPECLTSATSPLEVAFFLMIIILLFAVPLCVLVTVYAIIARHLMASTSDGRLHRARRQVVLMLGTVVLSFFICLLPFRALSLFVILTPHENVRSLGSQKYYSLLFFCRIMFYINSGINPILYNLMSSKFRQGFMRLWRGILIRGRYNTNGIQYGGRQRRFRPGAGFIRGEQGTLTTTTTTSLSMTQSRRSCGSPALFRQHHPLEQRSSSRSSVDSENLLLKRDDGDNVRKNAVMKSTVMRCNGYHDIVEKQPVESNEQESQL